MTATATPLLRRVSRRDLAENRIVWMATASMLVFFAVVTGAMALAPNAANHDRLLGYLVLLAVIALVLLRAEPPAVGTAKNHAVIAATWMATIIGLWAFQPDATVVYAAAIFIGPLTAVRLQRRLAIFAHYAAASVGLALLAGLGGVTDTTMLAIALMIPSIWAVGTSSMMVLEAAEAQGDELERLVRRDPLTGVGNRRLLLEHLDDELRKHIRHSRPLSVIALDLNGFKGVNDTLGHAAGDALLRMVASALESCVAERDVVVRQGGDEFCLILEEASPAHAARTGNAIRAALAAIDYEGLRVTTGIGIASFPDDADTSAVLLHVADERLREHKSTAGTQRVAKTPPPLRAVQDRRPGRS